MILDSSAIVAILSDEPGASGVLDKLHGLHAIGIGAPTLVETALVLSSRLGGSSRGLLERFLADLEIVTVPFGDPHWREAAEAFRRFGKGRHSAALNFGDCMAYAVAKLARQPLLCVGNDFSKTDLELA